MKIRPFVKAKALPTMLQGSVRSIMLKSVNVTVMTITLNAMPRLGVNKTDITQQLVLFRNMSTALVRVTVLCIKAVKPIMTVLVKIPALPRLARPAKNCMPADAVLMITHTVPAVNLPVVRQIRL